MILSIYLAKKYGTSLFIRSIGFEQAEACHNCVTSQNSYHLALFDMDIRQKKEVFYRLALFLTGFITVFALELLPNTKIIDML